MLFVVMPRDIVRPTVAITQKTSNARQKRAWKSIFDTRDIVSDESMSFLSRGFAGRDIEHASKRPR
jgi:hypothetical protein